MIVIFNVLFVLVLNSSRIFIVYVVFDLVVVVFPPRAIKVNVMNLRIKSQASSTIVALS